MPSKSHFESTLADFCYYLNVYFFGCIRKPQVSTSGIHMSPLRGKKKPRIFNHNMAVINAPNAVPWSGYPSMGVDSLATGYLTACLRTTLTRGTEGTDSDAIDSWLLEKGKKNPSHLCDICGKPDSHCVRQVSAWTT